MPQHTMPAADDDPLITRRQLAAEFLVDEETLRKWERAGLAPDRTFLGPQTIRYRRSSINRWLDARTATSRGGVPDPASTGGAA